MGVPRTMQGPLQEVRAVFSSDRSSAYRSGGLMETLIERISHVSYRKSVSETAKRLQVRPQL